MRPFGITVVAALAILFGVLEVITAFRHEFAGIVTSSQSAFTYSGAVLGLFYLVAGFLILTMRRRLVAVALALLALDVIGRLALVATGLYPTGTLRQTFAIAAGTALAALFAIYIASRWSSFR